MKKSYQHPLVEMLEALCEDVLTTSIPWQDEFDFGQDDPYTRNNPF